MKMLTNNLIQDVSQGNPIITVAEVQSYMNNTDASLTSQIQTCISAISQTWESYCNTVIKLTSLTGYYSLKGNKIYTNNIPINSVTSVQIRLVPTENYSTIPEANLIVNNNYIQIYNYDLFLFPYHATNYSIFDFDEQMIKVIYSAGYSDCPADLKKITIEAVSTMIEESNIQGPGKSRLGIKTNTAGGGAGTETYNFSDLDEKWKIVLDKYKRLVL